MRHEGHEGAPAISPSCRSRFREVPPPTTPGRFHLAAYETNYLSQKKISSGASVKGPQKLRNRSARARLTGGNGGCTNNLCTCPGFWPLLAGLTMAEALALV